MWEIINIHQERRGPRHEPCAAPTFSPQSLNQHNFSTELFMGSKVRFKPGKLSVPKAIVIVG